ncbi:hypothetical protein J9332_38875, partial [Aquimarina celericrescens]|nr:hypothetical protein [Aquimarina celericrescens]
SLAIHLLIFSSKQNEIELLEQKNEKIAKFIKEYKTKEAKKTKERVQNNSLIIDSKMLEHQKDNTNVVSPVRKEYQLKKLVEKVDYKTLSDTQLVRALRNQYLHISFSYK